MPLQAVKKRQIAGEPFPLHFDFDNHFVLLVKGVEQDPVIVPNFRQFHEHAFNLHRENITALHDEHVIRTSADAVDPAMGAPAWACAGEKAGQIAGAKADDRHGLAVERSHHQFADFTVSNGLQRYRIDDFDHISILPDVQAVLLRTFEGDARTVHFGEAERVVGLDAEHLFNALPVLFRVRLGADYQARVREAFDRRWIDVYENKGKRSGAYSAPVYGAHPYMLLNYNDTLDAVFTLAHEMGHSMHTLLAHDSQPFVYAGYTIFVAEVPSTLNEELLLEFMLERATTTEERTMLLQHAIDGIVGTFYNQVVFADYELEAHRMVERDEPVTADGLSALYARTVEAYWGDVVERDERTAWTWARIPHFFQAPYYVYQYATCMASTAALMEGVGSADPVRRDDGVRRYLDLLRAGGSDHPMALLKRAGVDLAQPTAIRALVARLDRLVGELESALG